MKKILFTAIATLSLAAYSFGQGEVLFSTGSATLARIYTNSTVGGQADFQNGAPINQALGFWTFALFYAPTTVSNVVGRTPWLDPNWTFSNIYGTNTGPLGRFAGWTPGNPNSAGVIPGYAAGTSANLVGIGWNTGVGGVSLAEFESHYQSGDSTLFYGYSKVATVQLGNGALIPDVSMFGAGLGQVGGFTLAPIPEPTTFALAGLGAAAMLIFRRRK